MKCRGAALIAVVGFLLAACGGGSSSPTTTAAVPARTSVVATTTQIGDFARVIGGSLIDLKIIAAPDADPHNHAPTPDDITALATARVVLKNGAGLESWFDRAFDDSDSKGLVKDTSDGVQFRKKQIGGVTTNDPHIWLSVVNARIMVANVTAALVAADPANTVAYQGNERAYDAQLDGLSREIRQSLARLKNKTIVTTHNALGYYTDEFALVDGGSFIDSFDPSTKPTAVQTQRFSDSLRAHRISTVFGENTFAANPAGPAAAAGGATVVAGTQQLYVDALGPSDSDVDSYLKMMRHNTSSIVNNLV